jgi:hypothetical protein
METMLHLMTTCPFARQVWYEILSWLRMTCRPLERHEKLINWWHAAKLTMPKPLRKGLASIALLMPWVVWKQRNECVFEGAQPSVDHVVSRIKDEAALWARAGALGLRVILPQTWDVH